MNLYRVGLANGLELPTIVKDHWPHRAVQTARDARDGFAMVRKAEPRFYRSGIAGYRVGAATSGPVGSVVNSVVDLILDIVHVLLLVGGGLLLWQAVKGGFVNG